MAVVKISCVANENENAGNLMASGLTLSYGDGDSTTYAVQDISLSFPDRGFFGVIGPSGSGKSSLLYLLSGLKQPTNGTVEYRSVSLAAGRERDRAELRRKYFGFVFQQPFLLNHLTARENVVIAARTDDANAANHVQEVLEELGIGHLAGRFPAHLSGGERQRLVVARAMISEPAIIFADEPTASLDQKNGSAVVNLLMKYRTRGTVIMVTHDPDMLAEADGIYHLRDGVVDRYQELKLISTTEQV